MKKSWKGFKRLVSLMLAVMLTLAYLPNATAEVTPYPGSLYPDSVSFKKTVSGATVPTGGLQFDYKLTNTDTDLSLIKSITVAAGATTASGAFTQADMQDLGGPGTYTLEELPNAYDSWPQDTSVHTFKVGDASTTASGLHWQPAGSNGNPFGTGNYFSGIVFNDYTPFNSDVEGGLAVGGKFRWNNNNTPNFGFTIGSPYTGLDIPSHDPRLIVAGGFESLNGRNVQLMVRGGDSYVEENIVLPSTFSWEYPNRVVKKTKNELAEFFNDAYTDMSALSQSIYSLGGGSGAVSASKARQVFGIYDDSEVVVLTAKPVTSAAVTGWVNAGYIAAAGNVATGATDFVTDFKAKFPSGIGSKVKVIVYNVETTAKYNSNTGPFIVNPFFPKELADSNVMVLINVVGNVTGDVIFTGECEFLGYSRNGGAAANNIPYNNIKDRLGNMTPYGFYNTMLDRFVWNFPITGGTLYLKDMGWPTDKAYILGSVLALEADVGSLATPARVNISGLLVAQSLTGGDGFEIHTVTAKGKNDPVKLQFDFASVYKPVPLNQITIRKVDGSDKLLDGAQFTLTKDGGSAETYTVSNGKLVIANLSNGTYKLKETEVPDGYTAASYLTGGSLTFTVAGGRITTHSGGGDDVVFSNTEIKVINREAPKVTSVTASKKWEDENLKSYRPNPADFALTLYRDGQLYDYAADGGRLTETENEGENTWTYTFSNLPIAKPNGTPYAYTVGEPEVLNYSRTPAENVEDGETITNKIDVRTKITATKKWVDKDGAATYRPKPEAFELTLLRNNGVYETYANDGGILTQTEDGDTWTYEFSNLPKYRLSDGTEYTYTIEEQNTPANYVKDPVKAVADGETITNTIDVKTSITAKKKWEDEGFEKYRPKPEDFELKLYRNGMEYNYTADEGVLTQTETDDIWTYTFSNLPMYRKDTGAAYKYTIGESVPSNYTRDPGKDVQDGETITNKLNVASITINKKDNAGNPLDGAEFTLTKTAGSPDYTAVTIAGTNGVFFFGGLTNGTYTLTESKVPTGYDGSAPVTFTVYNGVVTYNANA
ncbi:MAG: Cna B-type domain-containing protein, partial [Clostridiales bacterium]|nr:Cna B-type domain-containing protein [Clostridiales bacterium]